MLRKKNRNYLTSIFLFCFCSVLFAGCTHNVNVPLKPNYGDSLTKEGTLSSVKTPVTLLKGSFTDKRADTSKLAMFKQQAHTFNLHADRPIGDVIFDGLKELFLNSGHKFTDSAPADVRVDISLLNISASRNAGMVRVTASSSIQIKLSFTDMEDNVIYTEIYNGTDDRGHAMVGTMNMVYESIDAAIVNCINNVGKDENLANALRKLGIAS